ncbi:hypothetical protein [Streptomyces rishiriensis]
MSLFGHLVPAKTHSKGKETTTSKERTSHHGKHHRHTRSTGTHK